MLVCDVQSLSLCAAHLLVLRSFRPPLEVGAGWVYGYVMPLRGLTLGGPEAYSFNSRRNRRVCWQPRGFVYIARMMGKLTHVLIHTEIIMVCFP